MRTARPIALPQPHPLSCEQQPIIFTFDRIYSAEEDDYALYKHSIKEVVESTLLGYHGTVLFFGSPCHETGNPPSNATTSYAICKAATQMFRCLKKSRRSKSHSVSNLVVLSSFLVVIDENVHDLLHGYSPDGGSEPVNEVVEIPKLSFVNGTVIRASIQKVNTTSEADSSSEIWVSDGGQGLTSLWENQQSNFTPSHRVHPYSGVRTIWLHEFPDQWELVLCQHWHSWPTC